VKHLRQLYSGAGAWAVVTGGSDGIGRALALQLATAGFNVCVIARTQSKLDEVVEEIQLSGRKGLAIAFDFSTCQQDAYDALFRQLDTLDISILVNNVGMSHLNGELYEVPPMADELKLLLVNCLPMLELCKYMVPKLKAKRCGAIVNLSSLSAVVRTVPYLATYAGTKSFNQTFSDSLAFELQPFGVDVLTVTPGFVSTGMTQGSGHRRPRTNFQMVDVNEMAKDTLSVLGRRQATAGHRYHQVLQEVYDLVPRWVLGRVSYQTMKAKSELRKKVRRQDLNPPN
jgi:17beta-estradiol 17-dehydrogenase / very-long-chain 3-oxoacyl-CoA reductase